MLKNNTLEYKKLLLIRYLNGYLSRYKLNMRWVMNNILIRLKRNETITLNQFNSIIKFIEREKEFVSLNRGQIVKYFDELIGNEQLDKKENTYDNDKSTLEPFFT